uniref:Uncharacterized protein n=1 Tax=Oryza brachyantha TaxID=4533 RepID=J3NF28_ORYBR
GLGGELAGVDEGAVEAIGDARRELDGGLEAHVGGVDDEELGGAGGLVADEGEDVAVVLAAGGGGGGAGAVHGDEAGLAAEAAGAVVELGELAGDEVDPGEAGHLGPRLGDGEVGVPGLAEDGVGGCHAGADHHHLVGLRLLPRIPQVEAEAVRHVHPHHLRRAPRVLGQHAEPRRLLLVEHHGRAATQHLLELEHHLVIGHDDVVLGDGEVVDHRRLLQLDLHVRRLRPVGAEVEVLEVRLLDHVVAEREQLAGDRVQLWVRDHGAPELPVEVVPPDRLEVAVAGDPDLVREVVLGHGEEAAVEVDEAGVGDAGAVRGVDEAAEAARVEEREAGDAGVAVELADGLGEDGAAEGALLLEPRRLGEAAGVGLGGAVADADGVDHAVAVEQVVTGGGLEVRVGAVARVDAIDEGRDAARHR